MYGDLFASLDGGSGGGGASTPFGGCQGASGGGGGGGLLIYSISSITVNSGGVITANGGNGAFSDAGGSGAGSGGGITLVATSVTNSGAIRANGGTGGGGGCCGGGGSGGGGRILFSTFSATQGTVQVIAGGTTSGTSGGAAGVAGVISSDITAALYDCPADVSVLIDQVDDPASGDPPDTVTTGKAAFFSVTVTNHGPKLAVDTTVTVTLPAPLAFIEDTLNTCVEGPTGILTCPLGMLQVDEQKSFTIRAQVSSNAVDLNGGVRSASTSAEVEAANPDPVPDNNGDTTEFLIQDLADLRVKKLVKPDTTVRAGETFTYTIYVENLGPGVAQGSTGQNTGVSLHDEMLSDGAYTIVQTILDPNRADQGPFYNASPSDGTSVEFDLLQDLEVLDVLNGGRWVIQIVARANQNIDVNNCVTVLGRGAASTPDPDLSNNTACTSIGVEAAADLSLSVAANAPTTINAGQSASWTVTVTNNGPSMAENVVLTDLLPSAIVDGSSVVSGATCSYGAPGDVLDPVVCNLGSLASGASQAIIISGNVDPAFVLNQPDTPQANILNNNAWVTADTFDPDNSDNRGTASVTVNASADLRLSKFAVGAAVAGAEFHYEYQIANLGPSWAEDVMLRDFLPGQVEFISAYVDYEDGQGSLPLACSVTAGSNTLFCPLGNVPPTGTAPVVVFVNMHIYSGATGSLTGTADLNISDTPDPNTGNNTATVTIPLQYNADVQVSLASDPVQATAGETMKYTVNVTNHGPSDAFDVVAGVLFPNEMVFEIVTIACDVSGVDLLNGGGDISCNLGDLPAGESRSFDIWARVEYDAPFQGSVTTQAAAAWYLGDGGAAQRNVESQTYILSAADLRVTKFVEPFQDIHAGDTFAYTIFVDNLGPSTAWNVLINDTLLSSGLVTIDACNFSTALAGGSTITQDTCVTGPVVSVPAGTGIGTFGVDFLAPYDADGSGRLVATFTLTALEAVDLTNLTTVTADSTDPDPDNNLASVTTSVTASADLSVVKTGPAAVIAGDGGNAYLLTVTNAGPSTAENVILYDRLPAGIAVTAITPSQGSCDIGTPGDPLDRLTCGLGSLAAGASATVEVEFDVDADLPEGMQLENDALVLSDVYDPDNGDNYDSIITAVEAEADLEVWKLADGPYPWVAGEVRTYAYLINNYGPSTARNAKLVDMLPAEVEFVKAYLMIDGQAGSSPLACTLTSSNTLACQIGDVPVTGGIIGSTIMLVDVRIRPDTPDGATITNNAFLISDTSDPDMDNNSSDFEVTVSAEADLEITKTSSPAKVYAGEQVKYTLTVTNDGPSDATEVAVTDTLPAELAYEIDSAQCSVAGQVVTCALGPLPAGESRSIDIWARLLPDTLPGTVFVNQAEVAGSVTDPDSANNTAQSATLALGKADLRIVKFGKPDGDVRAGESLEYTIVVDNLGPGYAHDVVLVDLLRSSGNFELVSVASDRLALCTPDSGTFSSRLELTCTLGEALETQGRWTLTVTVTADEAQDINNLAVVQTSNLDPDPANNLAEAAHAITEVVDLSVTKTALGELQVGGQPGAAFNPAIPGQAFPADPGYSASTAYVTAGRRIAYSLTVANAGPSTGLNLTLKDLLPAGVQLYPGSLVASQGSCQAVDGELVCGLGSLAPGSVASITYQVAVDSALPAGMALNNSARVYADSYEPDNADNFAQALLTVQTDADIELHKTAYGENVTGWDPVARQPVVQEIEHTVTAGMIVRYQVDVSNAGPSLAHNVQILEDLAPWVGAANTEFLSAEGATCYPSAVSPNMLTCYLGDLAVGQRTSFEVYVRVLPSLPTVDVPDPGLDSGASNAPANRASLVTDEAEARFLPITSDPYEPGNIAYTRLSINRVADLSIAKQASDLTPASESGLSYKITVSNAGPSAARDIMLTDLLPSSLTYLVDTIGCGLDALSTGCNLGNLGVGESLTFDVLVLVNAGIQDGTVIRNEGSVASGTEDDFHTGDNHSIATVVIQGSPVADSSVLVVSKQDAEDPVSAGDTLHIQIAVQNYGPSIARQVRFSDTIPSGLEFSGFAIGGSTGSCIESHLTGTVDCFLGDIVVGAKVIVYLDFAVSPGLHNGVTLTDTVTWSAASPAQFNGDTEESTTVSNTNEQAFGLYLPIIFVPLDNHAIGGDLVIRDLSLQGGSLAVTIVNQGLAPVVDPFWVDVYLNPNEDLMPNRVWWTSAQSGLVWGIPSTALPLDPGESILLLVGDPYYWPSLSSWPETAQSGLVYAQVDSFGPDPYGAVQETDELPGGTYNNISGPLELMDFILSLAEDLVTAAGPLLGLPAR